MIGTEPLWYTHTQHVSLNEEHAKHSSLCQWDQVASLLRIESDVMKTACFQCLLFSQARVLCVCGRLGLRGGRLPTASSFQEVPFLQGSQSSNGPVWILQVRQPIEVDSHVAPEMLNVAVVGILLSEIHYVMFLCCNDYFYGR